MPEGRFTACTWCRSGSILIILLLMGTPCAASWRHTCIPPFCAAAAAANQVGAPPWPAQTLMEVSAMFHDRIKDIVGMVCARAIG